MSALYTLIRAATVALSSLSLQAAAAHYFLTTMAGYVPPATELVALNQAPIANIVRYDSKGNLYYAANNHIWRLNADGTETLIAGSPSLTAIFQEGEPAVDAPLSSINDFTFDSLGNLFLSDAVAYKVYKVTPAGIISTFAGNGVQPGANPVVGPSIPAPSIALSANALTIDDNNNVYLLEPIPGQTAGLCFVIVSFPPDGSSSAFVASSPTTCSIPSRPNMVSVGSHLFVADFQETLEVSLPGSLSQRAAPTPIGNLGSTLAVGPNGFIYGQPTSRGIVEANSQTFEVQPVPNAASISGTSIAVNPVTGDVAVASGPVGVLTVSSGKYQPVACNAPTFSGDGGPAILASIRQNQIVSDSAGNLYLADSARIRKISANGIITTIAGTGTSGNTGDNGPAPQAEVDPGPLALDNAGNLYFINNNLPSGIPPDTIRKIDRNGNMSTVAGGGTSPAINGASATSVTISPSHLASDPAGNLYFDSQSQLFKLNPSGTISLIAGRGGAQQLTPITSGTPALNAGLGGIVSIAVNPTGAVYFSDIEHQAVFLIDSQGNLQVVAGVSTGLKTGTPPYISAGPATSAVFSEADHMMFDAQGNLYFDVTDGLLNTQIVVVDDSGNLTPIGGATVVTAASSSGDGADATLGTFASVRDLAIDGAGNIYVSDTGIIRKMSPFNPSSPPPFISANGIVGAGGSVPAVQAASPGGVVSIFGANFVAAADSQTVSASTLVNGKVPTTLAGVCVSFGSTPAVQPAAMIGVYPGQLNVQVGALPPGPITAQVTVNCGTQQAVSSNISALNVQAATPEFYSFLPDHTAGHNPIAAVNVLTGAFIGPPGLIPGATFAPAKPGDSVVAYATGFGATSPAYGLGVLPGAAGTVNAPGSLTLGGTPVPILYAGISPCCAGFYQVNFVVPSGTPPGPQSLVITIAGVPSPPQAYLQIGQ